MKKLTKFIPNLRKTFAVIFATSLIFASFACKTETNDTTAPAEVFNLAVTSANGNAVLTWTNPTDADFAGVKISVSPAAGTLENAVTLDKGVISFTASGLTIGSEYTFTIQTFDTSLNYSLGTSKIVVVSDTSDKTAPADITKLTATAKNSSVLLTWTDPSDKDLFGIEITYTSNTSTRSAINAMEEKSIFVAPKTQNATITNLTNGTSYTFTLKAMDTSGNKSSGVTVSKSPVEGETLKIALVATPNNAVNEKTNTSVTVTAYITTVSTVKKVVYKKDGSINAASLFADEDATELTVDENDNKKWTFTLTATDETANGTYTVAAIDEAGREETAQIEIDNFDFTAPANVTQFSLKYNIDSQTITLNWVDPCDEDFDHILISYIASDSTSGSEESDAVGVAKGTQTFVLNNISSVEQYYNFYIKRVDSLGNTSVGTFIEISTVYDDFHETVTSAGTTTINDTEYKLVYFGDWPQTIKSETVTVDETKILIMGGNNYYLGSDNNYYAKCTENASSSSYTYSDGTTVAQSSANSTKYFKVEPITWRVLTEDYNSSGKALLLAEDILTANVPYYGTSSTRTLNSTTIYANNYKYSNIRAYLNGTANQFVIDGGTATQYDIDWTGKGFFQSAFTDDAQSLIETTSVDNSEASTNPARNSEEWISGRNSYACDDTEDKIFLLSEKEVTTTDYGFDSSPYSSSSTRIRSATDWTTANGNYDGYWCRRSPYYNPYSYYNFYNFVQFVDYSGRAEGGYSVDSTSNLGIVPALCVSLSE